MTPGEARVQRLFVAVEIAPAVAIAAGRTIEQVRRRASMQAPDAKVTWVDPGRLHITIQFIGEVEEPVADRILAALAPPLRIPPFDLIVAGVGAFPPRGAPRVIWAGLIDGTGRLPAAAAEVGARLEGLGIRGEDRPFNPHLTLARVRVPAGLRPAALFAGLGEASLGVQRVDAITLVQSRLSPQGPAYVPLQRTPLAGG